MCFKHSTFQNEKYFLQCLFILLHFVCHTDFWYGWFLGPLTAGEYPASMRETVSERLPTFTAEQKEMITGSLDFVALNYYFPYMTSPGTIPESDPPSFFKDMNITSTFNSSWPLSQTGWGIYGPGLRDLLLYTKETYPGLPMYVTENGLAWEEKSVCLLLFLLKNRIHML